MNASKPPNATSTSKKPKADPRATRKPTAAPLGEPSKLGEALRRERRQRAERQAETADRFGIHQTSYHRWETGETVPGAGQYGKVAEFLGIPLSEVWELAEGGEQPTSLESLKQEVAGLQRQIDSLRAAMDRTSDRGTDG